jgi:phosphoadenosine phosphosulfate reductase
MMAHIVSIAPDRRTDLVREWDERFDRAEPAAVLRWALEESPFGRIGIASSFQAEGTAVIHMAIRIRPDVPILFLDTGFHFAETMAFKERLTELLGLNVIELQGDYTVESQAESFGPRLYERNPQKCCELNKVLPFQRALSKLDAWVTSMRRDSAWTRADAPIVSETTLPGGRTVVKINPVANWTRRDVWAYLRANNLPHHPLYDLGYASIGCAPCSRSIPIGDDERAGRWAGSDKVECGMHVGEALKQVEVTDHASVRPPDRAGERAEES